MCYVMSQIYGYLDFYVNFFQVFGFFVFYIFEFNYVIKKFQFQFRVFQIQIVCFGYKIKIYVVFKKVEDLDWFEYLRFKEI